MILCSTVQERSGNTFVRPSLLSRSTVHWLCLEQLTNAPCDFESFYTCMAIYRSCFVLFSTNALWDTPKGSLPKPHRNLRTFNFKMNASCLMIVQRPPLCFTKDDCSLSGQKLLITLAPNWSNFSKQKEIIKWAGFILKLLSYCVQTTGLCGTFSAWGFFPRRT